jgi:hypothetical protein
MNWTTGTYIGYLLIAVPLTIWVARTLTRNGRIFLRDVFGEREGVGDAVNTLLAVGFYLLNVGFVLLYLRSGELVGSSTELLETLSRKIGVVMLVLGIVHFFNLYVISTIRRRNRTDKMSPVPPQAWLPPPAPAQYAPAPAPAPDSPH